MTGKSDIKPRKQPKQARSREMVEMIITATARVLVREGYEGTTTNRVAEVAGVSVGSLYQYFPNKESLLVTLMERHLGEMMAVFDEKFEELESVKLEDAVHSLVEAAVWAHAVDPELHRAFVEQVPRVGDLGAIREIETRIEEGLRGYLKSREEELEPGDVRLAAFLVFRTVEATTHAAVLDHPAYLEDDRLIDELTTLVVGYLSSHQPGRRTRA